jgi:Helix-turn-helix domain
VVPLSVAYANEEARIMMQTESLTLLTTEQASEIVRLSRRTLEGLRVRGGGPVYRKLSGRVFYALSDLVTWVDGQARTSTSDPGECPEREVP